MNRLFIVGIFLILSFQSYSQERNRYGLEKGELKYSFRLDSLLGELELCFFDYGKIVVYDNSLDTDSTYVVKICSKSFLANNCSIVDDYKNPIQVFFFVMDNYKNSIVIKSTPFKSIKVLRKKCDVKHIEFKFDNFFWSGLIYTYKGVVLKISINKEIKIGSGKYEILSYNILVAKFFEY